MAKLPQRILTPADESAWLEREMSRFEAYDLAESMMTQDERDDLDDFESGLDYGEED